jgi:hypothetical protein
MSSVILVMATLGCAIITSAAGVTLPLSVFAQQEETSLGERENIASGIVSGVLDGSNSDDEDDNNNEDEGGGATAGDDDDTNTQIAVPPLNHDQDQRAAKVALNEALDVTSESTSTPPPLSNGLEPEFEAFCLGSEATPSELLCFNTSEECERGEEFLGRFWLTISDCQGFEARPSDALICDNREEEGEVGVRCVG